MRNLDLDALESVSGGIDMRTLHGQMGPSMNDPLNHAFIGGPAVGTSVAAGTHPIDASQGQFFDPFGAPGHPTAVDPYHPQGTPYAYPQAQLQPGVAAAQPSPGFNVVGALPGVFNALGQAGTNPLGALGGVLGAIGGAQGAGSPLGAIGGLLGTLSKGATGANPLGALGSLFGGGTGGTGSTGSNPLGSLGGLFGGGGNPGGAQQQGADPLSGQGADPFGGQGGGDPFGGGGGGFF